MAELSEEVLKHLLGAEEKASRAELRGCDKGEEKSLHTTRPVLMERVAYLRKMAQAGSGDASETLKQFTGHSIMLSVRLRSGIAELHENFSDLFIVLDGKATLITGGTIVNSKKTGPGETRGDSVTGGNAQELRAGDMAHVPAGTPHQMVLSGDASFASIVVKLQSIPDAAQ